MDPVRELVDLLGGRLRTGISPGILSEPTVRGSISPVNTDLHRWLVVHIEEAS